MGLINPPAVADTAERQEHTEEEDDASRPDGHAKFLASSRSIFLFPGAFQAATFNQP